MMSIYGACMHVKNVLEMARALLEEEGKELKYGKRNHEGALPPGYKPELDITKEMDASKVQK